MKYILLILAIIFLIFIYYKIITPYPYPSKYYDPENSKFHIFTKDKEVIKFFTKYNFFIKSLHISGDEKGIKTIEIQSFLPKFLFNFYKIEGFNLKKTNYGVCYFKEDGSLREFTANAESFGFLKTKPQINFKFKKNESFEFESYIEKMPEEKIFKLKDDFDFEAYLGSSPHFKVFFPKIEFLEIFFKGEEGSLIIYDGKNDKKLKFGKVLSNNFKEEKLSFYLKSKKNNFLKKYLNFNYLSLIEEVEIKCFKEKNGEKCKGFFKIKNIY